MIKTLRSMLGSRRLLVVTGAAIVAVLAAVLVLPDAALAMPANIVLRQGDATFVVPTWFVGLAPVINYAFNAVIFKLIEDGTGNELPTGTKRWIVASFSVVAAFLLVLFQQTPLSTPSPGAGADVLDWFAFVSGNTAYILAGGTVVFALVEAAKAVMPPKPTA